MFSDACLIALGSKTGACTISACRVKGHAEDDVFCVLETFLVAAENVGFVK